jgi:hypothetical protein
MAETTIAGIQPALLHYALTPHAPAKAIVANPAPINLAAINIIKIQIL